MLRVEHAPAESEDGSRTDNVQTTITSTIANVAVAWVLRRLDDEGAGGWVVLGVRDTKHIAEHVALRDVALDDDDMAVIAKVLAKGEPPSGDIWSHERAR